MTTLSDAQVYARQLLIKRHGYPLWVPEPYGNSISCRTKGVRIGDVGYVTEDGAFETLFNVRASASDPINYRGVPDGFEQVRIPTDDIVHIPNFHQPDGIVTSANTKRRAIGAALSLPDIPGVSPGGGGSLQFTWTSSQGAILHLPTGASRLTCPAELFRDVAIRGAKNWYRFANNTLRRGVPNGSLYLITGCDKTSSWMVGAFADQSSDSQVSFQLSSAGCNGSAAYSYSWDTSCPAVFRTGPTSPPINDINDISLNQTTIAHDDSIFTIDAPNGRSQCVFVRGYRMMLRTTPLSLIRGSPGKVEVASISSINPKSIAQSDSASTVHRRSAEQLGVGLSKAASSTSQEQCDQQSESEYDAALSFDDTMTEETLLEYLPLESEPYHPSKPINKMLLRMFPDADVSLVHDDEWIATLCKDDVETLSDTVLASRILERYHGVNSTAAAFLGPRPSRFSSVPQQSGLPRRRIKPNGRPRTEPTKSSSTFEEQPHILRPQKSFDFNLCTRGSH